MTIRERENQLFRNWYRSVLVQEGQTFVIDGLVDEGEWEDTPFNVLYLSDEPTGTIADECEYMYRYYDTYLKSHVEKVNRLVLWLHEVFFGDVPVVNSDRHKQWLLRQIAVINMDKIQGSTESDRRVNSIIGRLFLREQLDMYACDLVLCDKTAETLKNLDTKYAADKWKTTTVGKQYLRIGRTVYLDVTGADGLLSQTLEEINRTEKMKWEGRRVLPL